MDWDTTRTNGGLRGCEPSHLRLTFSRWRLTGRDSILADFARVALRRRSGLENSSEEKEEAMRNMEASFVESLLRLQQRLFEIVRLSKSG